jgi:multiple sugar transport system ATP-binding protein
MNLVGAQVSGGRVDFAGFSIPVASKGLDPYRGRSVVLGIRPSDMEDCAVWRNENLPSIEVRAEVTEELGSEVNVIFPVDAPPVLTEDTIAAASDEGDADTIPLIADTQAQARFCARVDSRTAVRPGEPITLSLDPGRFHYFDPDTGTAIGSQEPAAIGA